MAAALNPYAAQLGNRNAREVIAETPRKLGSLLEQLSSGGLERSLAPGKWTARMILCHLADCEIAFSFRFRQALAEEHHLIQPFDQDAWARPYRNPTLQAQTAVDVFSALRGWNIGLLETISVESWRKPVRHPERGEMTFQILVETTAGHDINHLRQLEQIAEIGDRQRNSAS